jgi:hypothetical protein
MGTGRPIIVVEAHTDCLEAARLILLHMGFAGEVALPVRTPPVRPIYSVSLRRACRLLHVVARRVPGTEQREWRLNKGWRDRLRLAGVDPVKLEVVDDYRWGLAWDQLQHVKFRLGEQQRRLCMEVTVPEGPRHRLVRRGAAGSRHPKTYEEAQARKEAQGQAPRKISLIPRMSGP